MFFFFLQREPFPNDYGACECTVDPVCFDIFLMCDTSFDFQLNFFDGVVSPSPSRVVLAPGLSFTAFNFDGIHESENWLELSDSVKTSFLQRTDDFSLSMWVVVDTGSASSYLVSFENGRAREFSLFESSRNRLILYYRRGALPSIPPGQTDDGEDSQVAFSFYYDGNRLPSGIRDGLWHFISLSVDFPVVTLTVDGNTFQPTQGNYRNEFNSIVTLPQLTDGSVYEMPAPIVVKTQARIDAINGIIGGSQRGNQYALDGQLRQITASNLLSPDTYTCMASCNNRIIVDPLAVVPHETFYNPVNRIFEFSGSHLVEEYTALLRSLVYIDNGFLSPEGSGVEENRTIEIQIRDEVDFGTPFFIDIIGRQNLNDPVIDLNGDNVAGVGFTTEVREESFDPTRILALAAFIRDDDIDPRIEFVSVTFLNPQSPAAESIFLVDELPSVLVTSVSTNFQINITGTDPERATSNVFITALQSVRYRNLQDEPGVIPRQFEFVVSDGLRTGTAISTVTFETFNDVPVLDLNGGFVGGINNAVEYTEGDPALAIIPELFLDDPDSFLIANATVEIQQVFDVGSEMLILDSSLLPAGVVCEPVNCSGPSVIVRGSGALLGYQALLQSLQYINTLTVEEFPNLFDRVVFVYVSDGESLSSLDANIVIDVIPSRPRVILHLNTPEQNYFTNFTEVVVGSQATAIPCHRALRVVDTSLSNFLSVVVQIVPDLLPAGVEEDLETIFLTSLSNLNVSVEINTVLKRITFTEGVNTQNYLAGIERIRYLNNEPEPVPVERIVQFTVFPGGGAPEDSAFCFITIETINDNTPQCDPQFQSVEVAEDVQFPAGASNISIHTLSATDADVGTDGVITYSLASGDTSLFGVLNTEDSLAAVATVILLRQPNFEEEQFHVIIVDACDGGGLCCSFTLRINVTDANDNPPEFDQDVYTFNVSENVVMDFEAFGISDADQGVNAQIVALQFVTGSFLPSTGCVGLFGTAVFPVPILSTVSPGLDFETTSLCTFTIEAFDGGVPQLSATAAVEVTVLDVDDVPPNFVMDVYDFSVTEGNTFPLFIGTVTATDPDSPFIDYSLAGTTMFEVDAVSGNITIMFRSDRDVATVHTFTAVATDPEGRSDTAAVNVAVLPINDDPSVLDLNATDENTLDALTPVVFVEESASPVVLNTDPLITDPDDLPLTITRIQVRVVNSGSLSNEILGVLDGAPDHTVLASVGAFLNIEPGDPTDIFAVYELLQSITYRNTEDEISACQFVLAPCLNGPNSRTIFFNVFDGNINGIFSLFSQAFVTFEAVNDPPDVDLDSVAAGLDFDTVFRENEGAINIANVAGGFAITDDDSPLLVLLYCELTNPQDGADEFLLLSGALPSALTANISPDSYSIQISGVANFSDYTTALSLIQYNSITRDPTSIDRFVDVFASDGTDVGPNATTIISFDTLNQAPELDLDVNAPGVDFAAEFVEGDGPVRLSGGFGVNLFDADDFNMLFFTATLEFVADPQEVLSVDPNLLTGSIVDTFDGQVLRVEGAGNIITYREIINSVTYHNPADEIANVTSRRVVFVVADESGGFSEPVVATIEITPIDDNPPRFVFPSYNFTVSENVGNHSLVGVVSVIDLDLPQAINIPAFDIVAASPQIGFSDFLLVRSTVDIYAAEIRVIGEIDFDFRATSYQLTVRASTPQQSSTAIVTIAVINQPDLAPVFVDCPSLYSVQENSPQFQPLSPEACLATDPDGLDAIVYSMTANVFGGLVLVDIDPNSGEISVRNNINREAIGVELVVVITARDSTLSVTNTATIIILGINEFAPDFSSRTYSATTQEKFPPMPLTVAVFADDLDEQPDIAVDPSFVTRITYRIIPNVGSDVFSIDNVTGVIIQNEIVDFEESNQFVLVVEADDNDSTPQARQSTVNVIIAVENVNDEPPVFTNLDTRIVVPETTALRDEVYRVMFSDPDIDSALVLTFALPGPTEFLLNSATGVITVLSPLDADVGPKEFDYTLILVDSATDPSCPDSASISENITIVIEDENDISPVFSRDLYEATVVENNLPGTFVLQVSATDEDCGVDPDGNPNGNNELRYFLANAPVGIFAINESTGVITKLRALDREEASVHTFSVIVRDTPTAAGAPTNMDTAMVRITVLDVNEFPPRADPQEYFASVAENVGVPVQLRTEVNVRFNLIGRFYPCGE